MSESDRSDDEIRGNEPITMERIHAGVYSANGNDDDNGI